VDYFFRYLQANYYLSEQDSYDIIADFYVKMRNAVKKYNNKSKFSYYVWTIFKNTLKDYFKKNTDLTFTEFNYGKEESSHIQEELQEKEDIMDIMEVDFEYEQIIKAMSHLSDSDKDIVFLKFIENKTHAEI